MFDSIALGTVAGWITGVATSMIAFMAWRSGLLTRQEEPALVVKTEVKEILLNDNSPGIAVTAIVENVSKVLVRPREAMIEVIDCHDRYVSRYDWLKEEDPKFEPNEVLQTTRRLSKRFFQYGIVHVRVIIKKREKHRRFFCSAKEEDRAWSVANVYQISSIGGENV